MEKNSIEIDEEQTFQESFGMDYSDYPTSRQIRDEEAQILSKFICKLIPFCLIQIELLSYYPK